MSEVLPDPRVGRSPESEPVILLLPGMTLNGTLMPRFKVDTLAVDFCQFVPDSPDNRVTMGLYVERLRGTLAAEPLWRRTGQRVVVAHSFGGMLALRWLLEEAHRSEPDLPDGLVLVATTAGPMYDVLRLRLARLGGRSIRIGLRGLVPLWNRPLVTRTVKAVLSPSHAQEGRFDFRTLRRPTDFAVDLAGWRNTHWRAMRGFRLAMRGFDVRDRLHELPIPAIVLHGTDDALFPRQVGEDLARLLPRGRLRIVEGAGHVLPLTHGDAVVAAVEEMLGRSQETGDRRQESDFEGQARSDEQSSAR
jgi:pimeloyl-ACP methyl ester carboxylesterase